MNIALLWAFYHFHGSSDSIFVISAFSHRIETIVELAVVTSCAGVSCLSFRNGSQDDVARLVRDRTSSRATLGAAEYIWRG